MGFLGFVILFAIPGLLVLIDFVKFLIDGKRLFHKIIIRIIEIIVVIGIPFFYISILDFGITNDCCSDSATFSPEHRLSIYVLICICIIVFFYSNYRKGIAPPIPEIIVNCILMIGIILNVFIAIQIEQPFWLFGNFPVILLFIVALMQNQKKIIDDTQNFEFDNKNAFEKFLWKILRLKPLYKVPVFFLLSLPILILITALLMLFGQKPDSLISAFTDTYKHGLSQLDYMCNNVECGDHFLCSVAANGHASLVKPQRLGARANKTIICNRQLLVSNAFEELIQQKMPKLHKPIRKYYNRIGYVIHKHYKIFNNKIIADFIYILMKPLEWFFLITLYTFDKKPEDKIAIQYLSKTDRNIVDNKMKTAYSK